MKLNIPLRTSCFRLALGSGLLLLWSAMLLPACFAAERPNVLFLLSDDQRADAIAAWGNTEIQTPHQDVLVKRGVSFRNNYCFGSNSGAVCLPSRAMIHSGKSWMQIDSQLKGETTLGEVLQQAGYNTFATGKWHNGPAALLRSFQQGKNIFMGGMCDHTKVPIREIVAGKLVDRGVSKTFSSELFADAAIEFLQQQSEEKPYFAYVAFTAPHDPRNPPHAYQEAYYRNPPSLPANFLPQHPFDTGSLTIRDEVLAGWPRDPEVITQQLCEYYGLITHMDEQIGRILAAVAASPQAENTIIVYAADHGLAMGSHGLLGKQSLYEHSMKCPLIIAGPGIPADQAVAAFTYLYDIFPTLCALTDLPIPEGMAGYNLAPLWQPEAAPVREEVFLPYQNNIRSLRQGDWKLIAYPQFDFQQLFNLRDDPHEMHNLAFEAEHQAKRLELLQRLQAAQAQVGDKLTIAEEISPPAPIDLTGRERKPDAHQPKWIIQKYFQ